MDLPADSYPRRELDSREPLNMCRQGSSIAAESAGLKDHWPRVNCMRAEDWVVDTADSDPGADRPGSRQAQELFGHMGHSCSDPAATGRDHPPCAIRRWSWGRSVAGPDQTAAERTGLGRKGGWKPPERRRQDN